MTVEEPRPRTPWWRAQPALVGVGALLLLALSVVLGGTGGHLVVLGVEVGAVLVLRRTTTRARRAGADAEASTWRSLARAATCTAAGQALGAPLLAAGGEAAVLGALTCPSFGALAGSPFLYRAVETWCGYGRRTTDRFEWLNAVAAVLALTSGLMTVLRWADSPVAHWPHVWVIHVWMFSTVLLLVLVGSAVSVAVLGGLVRDVRLWVVAGGVLVSLLGNLAVVQLLSVPLAVYNALWASTAVALAVAARTRSAVVPTKQAQEVSALAALAVLAAAALALAVDGRGPHHGTFGSVPGWFAAASAVVIVLRMWHLVRQLAGYAESKVLLVTDDLTGVGNRRSLMAGLARSAGEPGPVALLVADVDGFKDVNDRFGHHRGDELLRDLAVGMGSALPPSALLARTGGDEFAVLLPGADAATATALARAVRDAALAQALARGTSEQRRLNVGMSVGVAAAETGAGAAALLRHADTAMYAAKTGGGGVSAFDHEVDALARDRAELAADLRALVAGGAERMACEVVLHYQPQVDVVAGVVVGVEALVRWAHPTRGLLPPLQFLDLVEELGLMDDLTVHVLGRAAADAVGWSDAGEPLRVSVNLSATSLAHPDLLGIVEEVLDRSALEAHRLVLEVTETTLMDDPDRALQVTHGLVGLGVELSIDDYGTGYSSLAYLTDLPATELKLDRAFTRRLLQEARTAQIVEATVQLAHGLGLRVVAEGVEDAPTLEVLLGLGVDESQGYLHSRPLPPADFARWLAQRSRAGAGELLST